MDIHKGYLLLVNKEYPLQRFTTEVSPELKSIGAKQANIFLEMKTATVLLQLIDDSNCLDQIIPVSGYRSRGEQERIYQDSLSQNGYAFTSQYVALPGCSEHQTGLAIDLSEKTATIDFICPSFPYDGIYGDFRKKATAYGFIERYEKGKEDITGISWEPWHFRYVGYPHSMIMESHGLCLEEYIDFIKAFKYPNKSYTFCRDHKTIQVSFILYEESKTSIHLPENTSYEISGNNVDGFILTTWR